MILGAILEVMFGLWVAYCLFYADRKLKKTQKDFDSSIRRLQTTITGLETDNDMTETRLQGCEQNITEIEKSLVLINQSIHEAAKRASDNGKQQRNSYSKETMGKNSKS